MNPRDEILEPFAVKIPKRRPPPRNRKPMKFIAPTEEEKLANESLRDEKRRKGLANKRTT